MMNAMSTTNAKKNEAIILIQYNSNGGSNRGTAIAFRMVMVGLRRDFVSDSADVQGGGTSGLPQQFGQGGVGVYDA